MVAIFWGGGNNWDTNRCKTKNWLLYFIGGWGNQASC